MALDEFLVKNDPCRGERCLHGDILTSSNVSTLTHTSTHFLTLNRTIFLLLCLVFFVYSYLLNQMDSGFLWPTLISDDSDSNNDILANILISNNIEHNQFSYADALNLSVETM